MNRAEIGATLGDRAKGRLIVDEAADMLVFDGLPKTVRKAIRNANFEMAASDALAYLELHSPSEAARQIKRRQGYFAAQTRVKVWGNGYPQT